MNDLFQLAPHYRLQWEPAQASHVLLFPEGMVELSDTAAAILEACREAVPLDRLIAAIEAQYEGVDVADDVREFLNEAVAERWVTVQRGG